MRIRGDSAIVILQIVVGGVSWKKLSLQNKPESHTQTGSISSNTSEKWRLKAMVPKINIRVEWRSSGMSIG